MLLLKTPSTSITRHYLNGHAAFDHSEDSFRLLTNPFPDSTIHPGPNLILRAAEAQRKSEIQVGEQTNIYRIGHPLAQRIIAACKNKALPACEIQFDYTRTPKKISLLEELVGNSGWLALKKFTIHSFETEDYLLLAGATGC